MSEYDINNQTREENPIPADERSHQQQDFYLGQTQPSPEPKDENDSDLTFDFGQLIFGVVLLLLLFHGDSGLFGEWTFYIYLAIAIIIHELGHVIVGKSFGCAIKEMQVFFLAFMSYKPKQIPGGSSWRDITWSLGLLPFGGVTVFKSRGAEEQEKGQWYYQEPENRGMELTAATSPYIDDKPAWQRLLISAAGVLFNFATFLILYVIMSFTTPGLRHVVSPLAQLSLILAVLNILPIYPLDGGAAVFALYEIVTGKKPSPMFTKVCGWVGFVVIILLFWVFPEALNGILNSVFRAFF